MRNVQARTRQARGVTLVELLVAVGILAMILSFAGFIFSEVTDAIQTGLGRSDALATSRSIDDQLKRDVQHMIPPGDAHPRGFLVIVDHTVTNRLARDNNGSVVDFNFGGNLAQNEIHADSIGFLVRYPESHPLQSMTQDDDNTGYASSIQSTDARVWYGHLTPVSESGNSLPTLVNNIPLGRQALLLADPNDNGSPDGSTLAKNFNGAQRDYADMNLLKLTGYGDDDDQDPAIAKDSASDYVDRMFTADRRLKVRTEYDQASPNQVSQMHPLLASGCSQFNVQVATEVNSGTPNWSDGSDAPMTGSVGGVPNATAYIWPYDETNNWPKLIRIRYRLHDRRGRMQSPPADGDGPAQPGQWYEQVLRVPQP